MPNPSDYSQTNSADETVPTSLYQVSDCSPDMRLIRRAKQLQRLGTSPKFLLCAIVEERLQAIVDAINTLHE